MYFVQQIQATRKELQDENNDQKGMTVEDEAQITLRRTPFFQRRWTILDKRAGVSLLIIHLLCLMAPFQFTWSAFWLAFVLYIITGSFGLTLSYHRHLSHKSFKLPKWLEYLFAYFAIHTLQGDPIDWVSTHRHHHQFVETERDPHSPTQGFWFAYIGWTLDTYGLTKKVSPKNVEDFEEKERKKKCWNKITEGSLKYGRPNNVDDLQKQPFYRFLRKTYLLHHFALALFLYALGGLPFLVWGMGGSIGQRGLGEWLKTWALKGVRIVIFLHITFSVNSLGHMWGNQQWNTRDQSRNNWLLALLSFGDGWHNNHHAFEYSARHGLEWWQLDLTWCIILFLEAIGLATDIKLPSQHHIQKLAIQPKYE